MPKRPFVSFLRSVSSICALNFCTAFHDACALQIPWLTSKILIFLLAKNGLKMACGRPIFPVKPQYILSVVLPSSMYYVQHRPASGSQKWTSQLTTTRLSLSTQSEFPTFIAAVVFTPSRRLFQPCHLLRPVFRCPLYLRQLLSIIPETSPQPSSNLRWRMLALTSGRASPQVVLSMVFLKRWRTLTDRENMLRIAHSVERESFPFPLIREFLESAHKCLASVWHRRASCS